MSREKGRRESGKKPAQVGKKDGVSREKGRRESGKNAGLSREKRTVFLSNAHGAMLLYDTA